MDQRCPGKVFHLAGVFAFVIVLLGIALFALALARAQDAQDLTVPVSVHPFFVAMAVTDLVSGCPSSPCAILMSNVTGAEVKLFTS
jgi:hypothetical protein